MEPRSGFERVRAGRTARWTASVLLCENTIARAMRRACRRVSASRHAPALLAGQCRAAGRGAARDRGRARRGERAHTSRSTAGRLAPRAIGRGALRRQQQAIAARAHGVRAGELPVRARGGRSEAGRRRRARHDEHGSSRPRTGSAHRPGPGCGRRGTTGRARTTGPVDGRHRSDMLDEHGNEGVLEPGERLDPGRLTSFAASNAATSRDQPPRWAAPAADQGTLDDATAPSNPAERLAATTAEPVVRPDRVPKGGPGRPADRAALRRALRCAIANCSLELSHTRSPTPPAAAPARGWRARRGLPRRRSIFQARERPTRRPSPLGRRLGKIGARVSRASPSRSARTTCRRRAPSARSTSGTPPSENTGVPCSPPSVQGSAASRARSSGPYASSRGASSAMSCTGVA